MRRKPRHQRLATRQRRRRAKYGVQRTRVIKTTYSTVSWPEDSDGSGDDYIEDHGWIDEEGEPFALDRWDREDGLTIPKKAAKWLRDQGALEPSSSHFHRGVWYSTEGNQDYRTGETETRSFHLHGFSEAEERDVFNLMTGRR